MEIAKGMTEKEVKSRELLLTDSEKADTAKDDIMLQEVLRGYRIAYLNDDHFIKRLFNIDSIRIYDKTILAIANYGNNEFVKARGRLLRDPDYITKEEQLKILEDRGIWSKQHDSKMSDLSLEVDELINERNILFEKIEKAEKAKKKKVVADLTNEVDALAVRMKALHEELINMTETYTMFFKDTIELKAQMKQYMGWIASAVCRNEGDDTYDDSKRLWRTVEDIEKDLSDNNFTLLLSEAADFWNSDSSEAESFFAESPADLTPVSAGEQQKK